MVCGNASYLSLAIVYQCQIALFKIELVPSLGYVTLGVIVETLGKGQCTL